MTKTSNCPAPAPVSPRRAANAPSQPLTHPVPAMAAPYDPSAITDMPLTRILHYWFEEVWCKGNLDAVAEVMTPETLISGAVSALAEPECDYSEVVAALRNLLGPIKVTFTHAVETADWVSVRLLADTSNPRDGTPFQITGQLMARVENGRIAEMHSNMDYFRMFEMLGQLPPEALAVCMTGERLK
ncbi:nuclear transport factor 2 family protein [Leisingera sp. ANG-Vp]|uniref:nuclear transport factor 2 family protein n=1 Tax=Leisingera sp. ANG-Vp TaxID=1577896 RepID=UPI0009E28A68|nr:nuclear transport factor 2 family protein [Leisingera sp. ANG-Vp]